MENTQTSKEVGGFSLTAKQEEALPYLMSDAAHIALGGGSRSGKTFLLLFALVTRALKAPNSRHVVFRYRFNAVKASVVLDTLPKVIKSAYEGLWEASRLDKQDWYIEFPNGSTIWFAGLDDKDRTEKILGMEFSTIYYNECSQIPYQSYILSKTRLAQKTGLRNKFYFDFNPPSKRHWTYRTFVECVDVDSNNLLDRNDYAYFRINPIDNTENISSDYIKTLEGMPERSRKRFLLGEFSDDSDNALWNDDYLLSGRLLGRITDDLPDFKRVVVAVDPSGCSGDADKRSDEIGIVVVALGTDGDGYLLEDLSGRHSPADWGQIVASAYERHQADVVVAEHNYGGAMVESVVRAANPDVSYKEVRASRGKHVRAEPIAALYQKGRVHHVGHYPEIEEQLLAFTTEGYMGVKSPDRADALIWGLSELFNQITAPPKKDYNIVVPVAYSAFG